MGHYNFGNLAYKLDGAPDHAPQRQQPQIRAIRTGQRHQQAAAPSLLPTAAKMAAIVLVLAAALSFVRIMLTSESVSTMIESDALATQISDARSTGTTLEMEQSVLSNPSAIKVQAKRLGMTAPTAMDTINLAPDVVAIENGHTLSLSGTIKNVVEIQE